MSHTKAVCVFCLCLFYLLAFVFGLLALLLPYWVSGKVEGVRTVTVVKQTEIGLFKEKSEYYIKEGNITDNGFPEITGTYIYPETVTMVKALMIVGLSLLFIPLVYQAIYGCRCCCLENTASENTWIKFYVAMSSIAVLSGGFILSCPLIYYAHVKRGVESEIISFGLSWYLAFISAGFTFIVGLWSVLHSCCTLCRTRSQDNEL
ncbi:uncharacterized protein LOC132740586 [Ruditapes philippinarum]|uniref:uncharacterized protein LOC132740586 n=1 Tax=Ruditapes philippinarum TaxID=129788 RepID=UPI00295AA679|nr:uncharacterized protein LOC132740586 [Ruditapes philippinarum]